MNHSRGFTLVELVMTIMIMGILAAVVGPRFFDRQVFDERMFFEEALSAVRYAQKLALASGCPVRAVVDGTGFSVAYAAACGPGIAGGTLVNDGSGNPYQMARPDNVSVTGSLAATFNSLGCVAAASPVSACDETAAPLQVGVGSLSLRVQRATGLIEVVP
ncbi:MAG: pilus assembly FimT family protein [Pseudomonadales bacterium]|nr:type II secretion system GspH family protein [Alphaproteobacteria bacterium]